MIGNAPSSGSTWLADLLDSTPVSATGEEISTFANPKLYDYASYRRQPRTAANFSLHTFRNGTKYRYLHTFGMNRAAYREMLDSAGSLSEFAIRFVDRFLALRGKSLSCVFFDQTPENINVLPLFLDHFPDGHFIFLVRHPLHVYASVKRRGFPPFVAATTWLIDAARFCRYRHLDRITVVKYEELVRNPYELVRDIIRRVTGMEVAAAEIASRYQANDYKRLHALRMRSWSAREYGKIEDANKKRVDRETLREFAASLNLKITWAYARKFDLAEVSFREAVSLLGYAHAVEKSLADLPAGSALPKIRLHPKDMLHIAAKWAIDRLCGDAGFSDLALYLHPTEACRAGVLQAAAMRSAGIDKRR